MNSKICEFSFKLLILSYYEIYLNYEKSNFGSFLNKINYCNILAGAEVKRYYSWIDKHMGLYCLCLNGLIVQEIESSKVGASLLHFCRAKYYFYFSNVVLFIYLDLHKKKHPISFLRIISKSFFIWWICFFILDY